MQRTLVLALVLAGCAGGQQGAWFSGSSEPRLTTALRIGTIEAVPAGYERLGHVSARCTTVSDYRQLDEEPLANVDCSEERLDRALRERAAEVGGELLADRECKKSGRERKCEADVARPSDEALKARPAGSMAPLEPAPAPGPEAVAGLDEPRVSQSWAIKLSFESRLPLERSQRVPALLGRSGDKPPQFQELGDMEARCEGTECELAELAHALRVAAARVGAQHLSELRCFDDQDGRACVGSLGAAASVPSGAQPPRPPK